MLKYHLRVNYTNQIFTGGKILTQENIIVLSAFAVYMVIMIVIGVVYSRRTKNNEDYFLGGRNLGGWTAAMSAQASEDRKSVV